jgi:hypothetical protein
LTSAQFAHRCYVSISNRGATNSQYGHPAGAGNAFAATTVTPGVTSAVDTTGSVDIVISGELTNASDTLTRESYVVKLIVP